MTQRELIIDRASKMFVSQGVKAVRMDDIAQELSISKRTLYELFGDKEELLYQSIRFFYSEGRERRLQQSKELNNTLEIMLICLRDMIIHAPVSSRIRRNLRRFYPSVFARLENDAHTNNAEDLKWWIKRCVESGYFTTTADCDFIVKVLQESVQGIMLAEKEERDSVEMISMMTYSIVIFIRGLCTQSGMEIIDGCFAKYFGNILSSATL